MKRRSGEQTAGASLGGGTHSPTECTIGHTVNSKAEVDAVMEQARTYLKIA